MFIVKAVRPGHTLHGYEYTSFNCDYYVVRLSRRNGVNGPGKPAYIAPQREIILYTKNSGGTLDDEIAYLDLGIGEDHYCTIYVMNDRGKTIDTIQADDIQAAG